MSGNDSCKEHFGCCDNCKPIMCCSGYMCGCYGWPVDFEHTDKCGDDCKIKKWALAQKLSTPTQPNDEDVI